uniref:Putative acetyltransferase n=1 Tax=viral metagenome TaxID=1070528 RepID=A0A6H1ZL20_9ZZZZ
MISKAVKKDLKKLIGMATRFAGSSKFTRFNPEIFVQTWENLFDMGIGVIFIFDDFKGMLGAIKYPDPNSGEMTATEMFWWVDPEYRGKGNRLLTEYEKWANENDCSRAIMVHLSDIMPEKLKAFYNRKGYIEMETHFVKEI